MDTLTSMKVFQQIIKTGSFVSASEKLSISKAMTTKHIKNLEERLGVRLINRTSRKISLTNEGKIYFERCNDILNDIEETESSLKSSRIYPKGNLKIAIPNWFKFEIFTNGIKKYLEKYPDVTIEFLSNDKIADLVEEGIDIALRVTTEPHSNLIARKICETKFFLIGSKNYLNKNGRPKKPDDLKYHKYITQTNGNLKNKIPFKNNSEIQIIEMEEIISTNNTTLISNLILSDLGLGFLPEYLINEEEMNKKVEIVLKNYNFDIKFYLFAVYSSRKYLSPKVRTFIDLMVDIFKNN